MADKKTKRKNLVENRRAGHEYFFLETYETGIELKGTEVKSLRAGKGNLNDAFGRIENGELWLYGFHISPYEFGNRNNHEELRPKRLLMHKNEIRKAHQNVMQQGLALIPLSVYLKDGRMKLELGLCRGKHLHDKRDSAAERDAKREMDRAIRERTK